MSDSPTDQTQQQQQQQQPPSTTVVTQQARIGHSGNGSVGPVIAVLAVITIVGVIAGLIGRLCSGRRVMGFGHYDYEGWFERKFSSCIDGHVDPDPISTRNASSGSFQDPPVAEPIANRSETNPEIKEEEAEEEKEEEEEEGEEEREKKESEEKPQSSGGGS